MLIFILKFSYEILAIVAFRHCEFGYYCFFFCQICPWLNKIEIRLYLQEAHSLVVRTEYNSLYISCIINSKLSVSLRSHIKLKINSGEIMEAGK